jgi:hypothetical protein
MVAEAAGTVYQALEMAAGEHVDVGGAAQVALFVGVEAVTVAGSVHAAGIVCQGGRQVLGGGQVRLRRRLVYEPDPTGPQTQQLRHLREGELQRLA